MLEIEDISLYRLEILLPSLAEAAVATEEPKATDPLRCGKVILAELIYKLTCRGSTVLAVLPLLLL